MKVKANQYLGVILVSCVVTFSCKGFSGVFDDTKPSAFIPGASVNLQNANGSLQPATVIDINGDGVADGLDLDGNGIPEILYISLGADRAVGLDLNGDGIIDYYLIINFDGSLKMQTARTAGTVVKVTSDSQGATGFDSGGAGGSAANILSQIRSDSIAPTIAASPAGGTFTGAQSITMTCSDNVTCNAIAYTTDGSTPSFAGGSSAIMPGSSAKISISSTTTVKYITRDAKGNVSSVAQQIYTIVATSNTGTEQWARTTSAGANTSQFKAVATDASGNVYVAGYQDGTGTYTYGGQNANGAHAGPNAVLLKFDSSGTAAWAKAPNVAPNQSVFSAAATDASGNIYAAGQQFGNAAFTYGSQGATGNWTANNAVLVKYDSSGTAQWARSTASAPNASQFIAVIADGTGNIYAAGIQNGNAAFTYGTQSATGPYAGGQNALLVKYDSSGTAQWARTTTAGANASLFRAVTVDNAGNIYAVGEQYGNGLYSYGTQNITGTVASGNNGIIVKFDSTGAPLWARTIAAGTSGSNFFGIAADSSGNLYVAGLQNGNGTYTYGTQNCVGAHTGSNAVVIKYDSSGTALWARTTATATNSSVFNSISVDSSGNIFAGGYQSGTGTFIFGTQSATGSSTSNNPIIVKYTSTGTAQWAKTISAGSGNASYVSLKNDASGNVFAAGYQGGNGTYAYGLQTATGTNSGGFNAILVKYQ